MSATSYRLTNAQALTLCRVLGAASQGLSRDEKFSIASVIRRIQNSGDYDPEIRAFRLLDPEEFDRVSPDGKPVLGIDGQPAKGYRYSPAILREAFPQLEISTRERLAIRQALKQLAALESSDCEAVAVLLEVAHWVDCSDLLDAPNG